MAVSMTYNSLLTDLRAYLERGTAVDPTVFEQLPSLINLAERDLANSLKLLGFVTVVTNTMLVGGSVIAKPNRWRATISMNFGVGASQVRTPLFTRSYEYCRLYWPDEALLAQPKFFADYDYYNWLIAPTPDVAYPFEVNFWQMPALLDDVNQTNWTTDFAPNALLHGALLQATPFLKNDERIPVWQGIYDRDVAILEAQDVKRIIDRQVTRENV
jgi:hypothetical protein